MQQKRGLLCAALVVVLAAPGLAGAAARTLVPGVTYERQVIRDGGLPVILHIVRTPPQGALYRVRPVLSHGTVVGRLTVPAMQRRLASQATTVGVNGDFFRAATGESAGLFLRDGILSSPPLRTRSGLALGVDGRIAVEIFRLVGSWRVGSPPAHGLQRVNRMIETNGVSLFTPARGGPTPRAPRAVDVVLTGFPPATLGTDLTGTVASVTRGGGTPIPRNGAVLQARGAARADLLAEATPGTTVRVRLRLANLPAGALDAIGGGPLLVRDGVPVTRIDEGFSRDQIFGRHPRTAVGQLADGSFVFVVADGRSRRSAGLTYVAMARAMARLGAVTATGLDGGGSSTISFEGQIFNTPSDGIPRRVASGLFLFYYGIYAPPLGSAVLSADGDGVNDSKVVSAKVVRPSTVRLRLVRPDGSEAWREEGPLGAGWISRTVADPTMPEGLWRWEVEATETAGGETSSMRRFFRVNRTLGHLRLSGAPVRVRPPAGGLLRGSFRLTRRAQVDLAVLGTDGRVRRSLFGGQLGPGTTSWRWNGRTNSGRVIAPGTYVVRVSARNQLGTVSLRKQFRVLLAPSR